MTHPHTHAELVAHLDEVGRDITATVEGLSESAFHRETATEWSASGYLQHLILSVKPLAKALALPPEQKQAMFGLPDHLSRTYQEVVDLYWTSLPAILPDDIPNPLGPTSYRFPEGVQDQKVYLTQTWADACTRLAAALAPLSEEDLDAYQLPHPAMGLITLREMLCFTHFHNTLHWGDIQRVSAEGKA